MERSAISGIFLKPMTTTSNALIAGYGRVGTALAHKLLASGNQVWAIRRTQEPTSGPVHFLTGDLLGTNWADHLPDSIDYVFFLASADNRTPESYRTTYIEAPRQLLSVLRERHLTPKRVFFASSTAVYGQSYGEWVDEIVFPGHRKLEQAHPFVVGIQAV